MSLQHGRYAAAKPLHLAEGWSFERLTPPSRLFTANGLRTGPDGRIYIAQVIGSEISALDLATGNVEVISAKGGDITAPDDIAFDERGNLFATEVMDGRVSVRGSDGRTRVLRDDIPCANGITVYQGRLFISECRVGGRLFEFDLSGGPPRLLLDNIPMPNAMEVGPDGLLYFPVMGTNEIWRIHPDGGKPEVVAKDLGVPDSVKFDRQGFIVSTQVHSGQVVRVDPKNGDKRVLAQAEPGLDNLTFVGDRLFVSNFTGEITEVLDGGQTRSALPGGLNWPLDLAVDDNGDLYIADGTQLYVLTANGSLRKVAMMFTPGFPSYVRGITPAGGGDLIVTTSNGQVSRYRVAKGENEELAQGLDQLYGVAVAPDGSIVAAELGAGRVLRVRSGDVEVLASNLRKPLAVAFDPDGSVLASESAGGRVVKLSGSKVDTLVDGLQEPQGLLVRDGKLYIVDAGSKELIAFDLKSKTRSVIASDLPVGSAAGVVPKPLRGLPPFSGPQGAFAGIAAGADGSLYLSADAEGSVIALRQQRS